MRAQFDSNDDLNGNGHLILHPQLSRSKPDHCALAVMTKVPLPGNSKTRLTPPLEPIEAAELSACFLRDMAANIASINPEYKTESIAAYTPAGAESALVHLLPRTFKLLAQRGQSFGERLLGVAQDLTYMGYESVCLIDSDSPTLPRALLQSAVAALSRVGDHVVLGEADDGGYYLIGLKKPHAHLFSDIDWSTSRVLTQTIQRAAELKLECEILPSWYDVDEPNTLRQLCDEMFEGNGTRQLKSDAIAYNAPHTRRYLSRLLQTANGRRRIWGHAGRTEKSPQNDHPLEWL